MIGDFAYVVTEENRLVRIDIPSLHQKIAAGNMPADEDETTVGYEVDLICSDADSLTVLSTQATLFDFERPDKRLNLNQTCGEA